MFSIVTKKRGHQVDFKYSLLEHPNPDLNKNIKYLNYSHYFRANVYLEIHKSK